jgi:A/G-specific adenine glycosylase
LWEHHAQRMRQPYLTMMQRSPDAMPGLRNPINDPGRVRWLRRRLFAWGRAHYRDFPWRRDRDPYRNLVTEILLKQTRADGVQRVRLQLLTKYPSTASLGKAPRREIEGLIAWLGFGHQRAAQLQALGRALQEAPIPHTPAKLARLPGIGPYAASATSCFAFGRREIALDVNVARIIGRIYGIEPARGELRKNKAVIRLGHSLIDGLNPRGLNWALLDLGALVCRPVPKCHQCPVQEGCWFARNEHTLARPQQCRADP